MSQTIDTIHKRRPSVVPPRPQNNWPNRRMPPYNKFRSLLHPILKLKQTTNDPSQQIEKIISAIDRVQDRALRKSCHIEWTYLMSFIETMFDETTLMLWKWHIVDAETTLVGMVKFLRKRLRVLADSQKRKKRLARRTTKEPTTTDAPTESAAGPAAAASSAQQKRA